MKKQQAKTFEDYQKEFQEIKTKMMELFQHEADRDSVKKWFRYYRDYLKLYLDIFPMKDDAEILMALDFKDKVQSWLKGETYEQ